MSQYKYPEIKWMRVAIDDVTNSISTITHPHHEIHEGSAFVVSSVHDVPITNFVDVQIVTPDTTAWAHFLFSLDTESETNWWIYEGVTINTAGTTNAIINRNRNSSKTSGLTVNYIINTSEANANADTDVSGATLITTGVVGSGRGSTGSEFLRAEFILKQNTAYTFRTESVAAGYINYTINWYEHTSKN